MTRKGVDSADATGRAGPAAGGGARPFNVQGLTRTAWPMTEGFPRVAGCARHLEDHPRPFRCQVK